MPHFTGLWFQRWKSRSTNATEVVLLTGLFYGNLPHSCQQIQVFDAKTWRDAGVDDANSCNSDEGNEAEMPITPVKNTLNLFLVQNLKIIWRSLTRGFRRDVAPESTGRKWGGPPVSRRYSLPLGGLRAVSWAATTQAITRRNASAACSKVKLS
jgi:hypothetical protein